MNERCKHIGKDGHRCGSYAFNLYKDDIDQGDLCDVHYWQTKAQSAQEPVALPDWFNHAFPSGELEAVGFRMPTPRAFAEEMYKRWKRRFEELSAPPQRKPLPPQSPCEMTQAEGKMFKLGWLECEAAHGIKENT